MKDRRVTLAIMAIWEGMLAYRLIGHIRSGIFCDYRGTPQIWAGVILLLGLAMPLYTWVAPMFIRGVPRWFVPSLCFMASFIALYQGTLPDSVGILSSAIAYYILIKPPRPPQRKRRFVWSKAAQTQAAVDRLYR